MATSRKFIPGSDHDSEEIFKYPFFTEEETKEFIKNHGKIMFIVRGPPGTGKNSVNDLLLHHYPFGVKCSANDYFTKTFAPSLRTRESLKESHTYCHTRVKQECIKGAHPVIVSNTHVKKIEMQEYLNYAEEHGYTIIIANTLDKFKVSPEILAKTNTKGLNKNYFENRLKTWQDVCPLLMGWFINIDNSLYLLQQLQFALDALLGDGRFCTVFDAFDKDSLLKLYKAKEVLFCLAGFMKSSPFELKDYYKSAEVREAYGKCFSISVQAYVITKSDIFATVELDNNLKPLTFKQNFENNSHGENESDISGLLGAISLWNSYKFKFIPLENDFSQKCKTADLSDKSIAYLNINASSFIHLAQREEKKFSAWELNKLLRDCFSSVSNHNGVITADKFNELEGGYKSCRLCNDAWVVIPPKDLTVKSIFTGLYI